MTAQPGCQCPTRRFIAIVGFTILVQFILLAISFPITELFSEKPLFYSDAGFHWYQMKVARNLAGTANVVGYDPYFVAGYPGGVTYDPSARGAMLAGILLQRWCDEIVTYKLYAFVSGLVAPLCVCLALRWLALESRSIITGTVLGFFLWWTSVFRWYHTAGMVSFVLGSYLAVPYLIGVLHHVTGKGERRCLIALAISGSVGFFYHPFFPVPIAAGTLSLFVEFWRWIRWRQFLGLGLVALCALVTNLFWLFPTRRYQVFQEFRASYQSIVDINIIWQELLGRWAGHAQGSKEYAVIVLASVWAWFLVSDSRERKIVRSFTLTGIVLIVFAAVGATFADVALTLQPNRFAPVGYLMLVIPATYGIRHMIQYCGRAAPALYRLFCSVSLAGIVLIGVYLTNEVRREISFGDSPRYGVRPPEVKGIGEYSRWVVDWLKSETSSAGRILFETSKARIYDGSRMAGYYAYTADRELIGGPYPYMHFAGFWDGYLFDRPIRSLSAEQFARYMDLYNIGWLLVHSEESKKYLDSYPGAIAVANFKQLRAYKLERHLSFFVTGSGSIERRMHNEIVLSGLSGERLVLKYHYVEGLKSEPDVDITPVKLMDDPNPFISIVNPPKRIRLYLP